MSNRRFALWVITLTYVAVTVGESILAPVLPLVVDELGLDTAAGGRVLGALSLSAGIGNLLGGALLARTNARTTSALAAACSVGGCVFAALAGSEGALLAAHVLIGIGACTHFAGGVFSVGALSDPGRTGRAMGRYGIAYSVALALAAGLVATIGETEWRAVFIISAILAAVILVMIFFVDLPGAVPIESGQVRGAIRLLGAPILVGGVAAMAQFGLVAYIPTFGVEGWALTAAAAAGVLFVGRIVSIPGKWVAGWMMDRYGVERSAKIMGLALVGSGLAWVLTPVVAIGAGAAVVFASAAGAVFPMANVVALDRFGSLGSLLGVFRSAQMIIAGVSVWLVGQLASTLGLRTALIAGVLALSVILVLRGSEDAEPAPSTAARG